MPNSAAVDACKAQPVFPIYVTAAMFIFDVQSLDLRPAKRRLAVGRCPWKSLKPRPPPSAALRRMTACFIARCMPSTGVDGSPGYASPVSSPVFYPRILSLWWTTRSACTVSAAGAGRRYPIRYLAIRFLALSSISAFPFHNTCQCAWRAPWYLIDSFTWPTHFQSAWDHWTRASSNPVCFDHALAGRTLISLIRKR